MSKERNGHANPEELRKLAADWRAQADRLESLGGTVMSAFNGIEWFGFAYLSASIAANAVNVKLRKMAEAAREFADFLDEYAAKVEEQIKRERAAGIIQAVLAILGLLTIGLAFVLAPALAALSSLLASLLPAMSAVAGRIATMVIDFALGFLTFGSMQVALEFGTRGVVFGAMGLPMEVGSSEILLGVLLAGGLGGLFSIRGLFSSVNSVPQLGPRGAPPVPKMQAPKITRPESANGQLASSAPVKGPDITNTPRVNDATPAVSASDITAAPVVPKGSHTAPTVSASSAGDASRLAVGAPGGSKSVNAFTQQTTGHVNQPLAAPHTTTTTTAVPKGGTHVDGPRMANLDRTDPHVGARGDFSPQANAPASNVVRQPAPPQMTERGPVATAQGRGISPESPTTGQTIHATPSTGPATVPHGPSLPPAMRPGGLPETSVLSSGNHLIPPTGRPGVTDYVPANTTPHTVAPAAPRNLERVQHEPAPGTANLSHDLKNTRLDKILETAPRITPADTTAARTADGAAPQHTAAPIEPATPTAPRNPGRVQHEPAPGTANLSHDLKNTRLDKILETAPRITPTDTTAARTADGAAPQHTAAPIEPATPTAPRNPGRVQHEPAPGTANLSHELKNTRLDKILETAPRITPTDSAALPRTADIAGSAPRSGDVDTAVAGHSDRSAATGVDSRLLDASAPPAPASVPAATPRVTAPPTPGRQLLRTGPDGSTDLVRVSAEPVFSGVGRRIGNDFPGPSLPGPGKPLANPAQPAGPDRSYSYTELRADGTMGPTMLRRGENVLHSKPLSGGTQEQILSYSASGRSWDVNPVAPAARPATAAQPTQILRQNPDGTVDLLTFKKPPTSVPMVKPRPGEASFHDLDGPGVRRGWHSRSIGPDEWFTAKQVSKPESTGQRLDGTEVFFQREPTSLLVKDQASHQWTPLGRTEGVVAPPKGWGRAPDAPPVTVAKPGDNPSFSREGTGQGTPSDNAHYRWSKENGTVEPVKAPATSLKVAEIGTQTRSVAINRWTATGGGGGGNGIDSLRMLPDGTLVPANPRTITTEQIRFDPKSGAITMDGAQPTGGHSNGGGGAPGSGGGGAPGPRGGGLSSRGPSHGSATQTGDGALTFVKPPSTAESSAAAMARDARTHAGAPGERPDPGHTLGSDKPATRPGAGIGGPAEAKAARTLISSGDDGQVVLLTPTEAPRNVLRKPQPEQMPSAEVRAPDPTPGGHPAATTPVAPAHDPVPDTPTAAVAQSDAMAQPTAPPVVVDSTPTPAPPAVADPTPTPAPPAVADPTPTPAPPAVADPTPAPAILMRAPLAHEEPYVTAMPEGLSMTVQGNVVHLHTGTPPTRLVLRPGPELTVVVDGSVTNLPTIRAALTALRTSQPPVSTIEFVGTRQQAITPQRAQQIADRLLTGLPGNPQISLLASAFTDAPAGAPATTSYRFSASTNPTPSPNLPTAPTHAPVLDTPTAAVAQPQAMTQPTAPPVTVGPTPTPTPAPPVVQDPTPASAPAPAPAILMRAPLAHEEPYVTAMPEGLSMTVQGNVVHLHTGTPPTRLVLRPGPDLTVIVDRPVISLPLIQAALAQLRPSQPPVSTVEFVGTRQPVTPERAQQIADRLLTDLPGNPQISLLASAFTDTPAGAPATTSYRFSASTNPTAGHNLSRHTDAAQFTEAVVAEQELHAAGRDVDSRFHAAIRQWRDAHPEQADRLDEVLPAVRTTFDARTERSWRQLWETGSVGRGWATEVDRAARELPALLDAAVARPTPVEAQAGTTVDESVAGLADDIFRRTVSTLEYERGLGVLAGHLAAMQAAFRTSMQATRDQLGGDDWDEYVAQQWTDLRANLVAADLAVAAAQGASRAFHSLFADWAGRPGALDATMSTHAVRLLGSQFARDHLAAHGGHFVGLEALQQQAFSDALAELRDPYTEISALSQAARTQQWTAQQDMLRTDYASRIDTARRVEQLRPDLVGAFGDAVTDAAARTERSPQLASLDGLPAEVADRFRAEFVASGRRLFDQVWAPVITSGPGGDDSAFQAAEHEWQMRYERMLAAIHGTAFLYLQKHRHEAAVQAAVLEARDADRDVPDSAVQAFYDDAQARLRTAFDESADPTAVEQWEALATTIEASIPGYFTEEALRRHAHTPAEGDDTRPPLEATAYESAARPVVDQAQADIHAALHRPGRDIDDATRQRITRQLDARIQEANSAAQARAERGGNTPTVVAAAVDGLQGTLTDVVRSVPVLLLHHAVLGEQVRAAGSAFGDLPAIDLPAPVSETLVRSFTLDWLTAYDELFRGEAMATTGLHELAETVTLTPPAPHPTDEAPRTAPSDAAPARPGHPVAPTDPAIDRRTTPDDAHGPSPLQQWAARWLVRWHVRPEGSVPPAPFGLRKSPDGTYALPDGWVIEDLPWYAWARPAQVSDEDVATWIRAGGFAGDVRFIVGEPGVAVPASVTAAGLDLLAQVPEVPGEPVPVLWLSDSELTDPATDTRTAADTAGDTLAANGHAEIRDAFLAETDQVRRNALLAGLLGEGDEVLSALPALHTGLPVVKASDAAMARLLGYAHGAARGEPLPVAEVHAAAMRLHTETKTTLMDGLRLLADANPGRRQVLQALSALILDC
ncbi:hypothetical protein ABZS77_23645 [Micromonospora sp. NPDC005298]|uniref:hypothetical protein n=1 Tax=Micromonospora sp. NPDC005298 TaxID=3156873 RepID=UPI0033AC257D